MADETYRVPLTLADICMLEGLLEIALDNWASEDVDVEAVTDELNLLYRLIQSRLKLLELMG